MTGQDTIFFGGTRSLPDFPCRNQDGWKGLVERDQLAQLSIHAKEASAFLRERVDVGAYASHYQSFAHQEAQVFVDLSEGQERAEHQPGLGRVPCLSHLQDVGNDRESASISDLR